MGTDDRAGSTAGDGDAQASSDENDIGLPDGAMDADELEAARRSTSYAARTADAVDAPSNGGRPSHEQEYRRTAQAPLPLDRWLWLWPAVTLLSVAVAGASQGPLGGLLAGVSVAATLALAVGREVLSCKVRLGILLVTALVITGLVLGHTWGIERLSTHHLRPPATTSPTATVSATPTATSAGPASPPLCTSTPASPAPTASQTGPATTPRLSSDSTG